MEPTHFLTVTYRNSRVLRSDGGDLTRVLQSIRRDRLFGRVFLVGEAHQTGDLHVHGVLRGPAGASGDAAAQSLWERCREQFGRSQVRRVRSSASVSAYCTKYVLKQMAAYLVD